MSLPPPSMFTDIKSRCQSISAHLILSLLFFGLRLCVTEILAIQSFKDKQNEELIRAEDIASKIQSTLEARLNSYQLYGLHAYLV